MNLKFKINYTAPLLISVIMGCLLIKLTAESLFFLFDKYYLAFAVSFRLSVSALMVYALYKLFFKDFYTDAELPENVTITKFFSDSLKIVLGLIILVAFYFPLPNIHADEFRVPNLLSLLYLEFYSFYALIFGFFFVKFIFNQLWIHRHQKTKKHLGIFKTSVFLIILFEAPSHYAWSSTDQFFSTDYIMYPFALLMLVIIFLMFSTTKKNMWIQTLPRNQKLKLLSLSAGVIATSFVITLLSLNDDGKGKLVAGLLVTYGSGAMLSWAAIMAMVMFFRISISTIASLPTGRLVERRTSEVISLTYLNRLVAESVDFDNLIDTVTRLAFFSCEASAAWTEVYKGSKITISAAHNIPREVIEELHKDDELSNLFKSSDSPVYADSIKDYLKYYPSLAALRFAQSMIAIPLFAGEERLGTLVALHPDEYGFEADDVSVLTAFSHNVNIALENARLLNDSLEKERFKSELMLAKVMEEKLLPRKLPEPKNYTLGAFCVPATIVGGDYYDAVRLKDGRICLLIGDVSGKGITAAFYMAQLKGVVLAVSKEALGAADLLKRINATLYGAMEKSMYITLAALVIEGDGGMITIARAGHLPFLIRKGGDLFVHTPKGIGVGLKGEDFFNSTIEEESLKLDKGDLCLMMTDGMTDLKTENSIDLNYDYLKHILDSQVYNNAEAIAETVRLKVEVLAESDANHDDMTLFVVEYVG